MFGKYFGVGVISIYWYFCKKDDLFNVMIDCVLSKYVFVILYIEVGDWCEMLCNYVCLMWKMFVDNFVLCDLILI